MTTTYDPFDPQYFDEADLRAGDDAGLRPVPRLPAVLQVLHRRSRRCSTSSTATTTRTRPRLTPAEQDQVVDECFQCKLCYVNCPYIPGQHEWALDFPRLMLRADAGAARRNAQAPAASAAHRPAPRPHRPRRQAVDRRPRRSSTRSSARPGSLPRKVDGEDRSASPPSGCCRRTRASGSRRGSSSAAPSCASSATPGRGRAVPDLPRRVPEPGDRPRPGEGLRAQRHRVLAARGPGAAAARRGCTTATSTGSASRPRRTSTVLADRRCRERRDDIVVPQPTCGYVLKQDYVDYIGGADAELVARQHLRRRRVPHEACTRARAPSSTPTSPATCPRRSPTTRLPPPGPEHRAQEPRPPQAHRHQGHRSSPSAPASTARGASAPRTTSCRRGVAKKLARGDREGRQRRRRRRLPPRQRRHRRRRPARTPLHPIQLAGPRLRHPRGATVSHAQAHPRRHRRPPRLRARARRVPRARHRAQEAAPGRASARSSRSCSRTATRSASRSRRWPGPRSSSPTRTSRPSSTSTTRSSPSPGSCRATLFVELTSKEASCASGCPKLVGIERSIELRLSGGDRCVRGVADEAHAAAAHPRRRSPRRCTTCASAHRRPGRGLRGRARSSWLADHLAPTPRRSS